MIDRRRFLSTTGGVLAALAAPPVLAQSRWPVPPQPPRRPQLTGNYGPKRIDEYLWLRTKRWHEVLRDPTVLEPEIKAVIDAENRYADAMLEPTLPLQRALRARAAEIQPVPPGPVEVTDGGFVYFTRRSSDPRYPIFLRRPAGGGAEQVVFDPARRAGRTGFYGLYRNTVQRSADGRLVGWAEDRVGSGQFRICVAEIATGRMLVDAIDQAHGSFDFDAGGQYLFWVARNAAGRPAAVFRRDLRSGTDTEVLDPPGEGLFIDVSRTASGGFVVIRRFNGSTAESYLVSAAQPTAAPRLVAPRMPDLRYTVDHWNDRLVILTDVDGAVDMKVMTAPIDRPERENWQELVPHRPGRSIVALHPFRDCMVRLEWKDAKPQLVVMRPDGGEQDVTFDEQAYTLDLPRGQDWDATSLTFGYESPRLPRETRRLTLSTGAQAAASPAIRSASFDPNRFVVERLEVPSTDGVRVPVTLLRRRDAARDGRSPLYLYAYGSYGAIQEASFVPANLALVERGWTFAIAHVRGGGERGSQWWRQILRTGKKRSFEDYLACADHLVRNGYTAAGRIVAEGFSAGGLLIGNAVVERPELFAGIVGRAAYVDPLGAKDIKDHPLGPSAIPIWGDPANPAEYAYIASYAPYEHLRKASLPAMLMVSSIADDRVMYTDALKFALRARALTTGGQPMMAKIASVGGHVGLPGPEAAAERKALFHAFAIWAADHRWGEVPQR